MVKEGQIVVCPNGIVSKVAHYRTGAIDAPFSWPLCILVYGDMRTLYFHKALVKMVKRASKHQKFIYHMGGPFIDVDCINQDVKMVKNGVGRASSFAYMPRQVRAHLRQQLEQYGHPVTIEDLAGEINGN